MTTSPPSDVPFPNGAKPEKCKSSKRCGSDFYRVPYFCIFPAGDESDCRLCSHSRHACNDVATDRNAQNPNSHTVGDCRLGEEYLHPASHRKFAKCRKLSKSYTRKMEKKQTKLDTLGGESQCSSYLYEGGESAAVMQVWDTDNVSSALAWGVCDVGPYWFRIECGRSFFAQLFQSSANSTLVYGTTDDYDDGSNSSAAPLLTAKGQCRYGVTSALASFGEDCHTATEKLAKRLKQSSSEFSEVDLQPNGAITCRCASREEMLVANLERFPKKHAMFTAAFVFMVLLPILCTGCWAAGEFEDEDGGVAVLIISICFAVPFFTAVALFWSPAQSELQLATFRAASPYESQFWQGCGTTLNGMPLLELGPPQALLRNISAVTPFGPETTNAPSKTGAVKPEKCKLTTVCSPSGTITGAPYCIWASWATRKLNDCKDCFFSKADCQTVATERAYVPSAALSPPLPPQSGDGEGSGDSPLVTYNAASRNESRGCKGFGVEKDGVCDYSSHQSNSMIRCSGAYHYERWLKKEKKRKGKNHLFVENVSFVEYFKHEYSDRSGDRPAEGPSGFGGMYVPGKEAECFKIRDKLNVLFQPAAWICTPVCKSKFNSKGKCNGRGRLNRRIRRLPSNTDKSRYSLKYHVPDSSADDDTADEINTYSLVGDGWKEGLRNREIDDDLNNDVDSWKNWRAATRVVGMDFTDCECQSEGDFHLTCVNKYVPVPCAICSVSR